MTKRLLRRIELSSLDYYTHHISPHTIPPKMTKLFSKLKLTKLFSMLEIIRRMAENGFAPPP